MPDRTHHHPGPAARRLAGAVALTLALLAGCGGPVDPDPAALPAPSAVVDATTPGPDSAKPVLAASHPDRLRIPAIDVDARGLVDLGLQADRTMGVPADGTAVGWYTQSPTPGERGPAVLAAHVDWNHKKGVFFDLSRLEPGDDVIVDRADGSSATFEVQRVEQYPKDRFPTQEVYGDVAGAELRLITCGGDLDREARTYRDNIVVYAALVSSA